VLTALGKYWVCKRATPFVNEAQECLGGAGYVEESLLPRLYRQAPLNSIWEGSGNIQCLDVLRALQREPESAEAFFAELPNGLHTTLDIEVAWLRNAVRAPDEGRARYLVERMALALQAALLLTAGHPLAEAFCLTRLAGEHGLAFGTLPAGVAIDIALERALPAW